MVFSCRENLSPDELVRATIIIAGDVLNKVSGHEPSCDFIKWVRGSIVFPCEVPAKSKHGNNDSGRSEGRRAKDNMKVVRHGVRRVDRGCDWSRVRCWRHSHNAR